MELSLRIEIGKLENDLSSSSLAIGQAWSGKEIDEKPRLRFESSNNNCREELSEGETD
jgi:hypothetical protein